jgi:hypothetical protein
MTITNLINKAPAGVMSRANAHVFTFTTTVDTYVVIDTVVVAGFPALTNSIAVTTNNLLFKFEYSRDGVNWSTSIEDFPIAAATTGMLTAARNALLYRVSVKPAAAGVHGSCTWSLILNDVLLSSEYRGAFTYEALTITSGAAVPLTLATFDGALTANITVENNPIRIRWDGTSPTTTEGHLLQAGDQIKLDFTADLWHFRAIATGADSKIRVTYSK